MLNVYFGFIIEVKSSNSQVINKDSKLIISLISSFIELMWKVSIPNIDKIDYSNVNSTTRPIPYGPEIPVQLWFLASDLISIQPQEPMEIYESNKNQPLSFI